jgi:hypothetical protein
MLAGTSGGPAGPLALRSVPAWISRDSAEKVPFMRLPGTSFVLLRKMLQYKL